MTVRQGWFVSCDECGNEPWGGKYEGDHTGRLQAIKHARDAGFAVGPISGNVRCNACQAEHTHSPQEEDGDTCACGQTICPDTLTPVIEVGTASFWHADGTTCFLHQTAVDPQLVKSWLEWQEFEKEDNPDPDLEPQSYLEWIQSQIDDHEQIWREEPKERDLTEQYLVILRAEKEKLTK